MIITKECKGLQTNTVVLEFSCTLGGFCRDKHNIGFYSETQKLYERDLELRLRQTAICTT